MQCFAADNNDGGVVGAEWRGDEGGAMGAECAGGPGTGRYGTGRRRGAGPAWLHSFRETRVERTGYGDAAGRRGRGGGRRPPQGITRAPSCSTRRSRRTPRAS
ncbi:hypothetical protein DN492_01255 [Burkholderia multivorans]|nr:hypothetical protein DN492_01255 [Burkholderia multivorans]